MADGLVLVGAGGFGREVLDVVDAINGVQPRWDVLGVVDDSPDDESRKMLAQRDVRYLGSVEDFTATGIQCSYAVGIGSPAVRREIASHMDGAGLAPTALVHPSVTTGFGVTVGPGSVLCAGVRVTTNVRIGCHVHINLNATVGHDTTIGDFVSINPLASISGECVIEDEVLVGVAGVVLNKVAVRRGATVGGSACVVRDVSEGAVVKGVPAR